MRPGTQGFWQTRARWRSLQFRRPTPSTRPSRRVLPAHDPTTGVIALQTMRLGRLIERRLQELLAPAGLERSELSVLVLLLLVGDDTWVSPTELAHSVVQTTSGMTKTLRRLELRDLIRARARDERDGRGVVARLTPAGRRMATRLLGDLTDVFDDALSAIDDPDRVAVSETLRLLLHPLEQSAGVEPT